MSLTTILAAYAAIVASFGACWQVWTWWQGQRMKIQVTARVAVVMDQNGPVTVVAVTAINRSSHLVRATNAALVLGRGALYAMRPHPLSSIPGDIRPHDSAQAFLLFDEVAENTDFSQPVRAAVYLSTGDVFKSEPTLLHS